MTAKGTAGPPTCFKRMCLSNTKPLIALTSLGCPLYAVFHVLRGAVPRDAGHLRF
jgi:hypothetical protein